MVSVIFKTKPLDKVGKLTAGTALMFFSVFVMNAMVFPTNSMKARTSLQAEICWVSRMGMPATVGWGSCKRSPNVSTIISRGY